MRIECRANSRKVEFKLNFILRPGDTAQGWLKEKNVEEKLEK